MTPSRTKCSICGNEIEPHHHPYPTVDIIIELGCGGIILIKRNEKRFWTRSLAREDADATINKRMQNTMPEDWRLH